METSSARARLNVSHPPKPQDGSEPENKPKATRSDEPNLQNNGNAWHNKPVHVKSKPSLLTSSSSDQNFRGFFNLALIIMAVSHFRIVIENFLKYGLLLNRDTLGTYIAKSDLIFGLIGLNLPIFISLWVEKLASTNQSSEKFFMVLHLLNALSAVILPSTFVYIGKIGFVGGIIFLMLSYVLFMKVVSFAMVCRDTRHAYWRGEETAETVSDLCGRPAISYPQNLNLKSMYYFIAAPVLVYQMNYPRTNKIRFYWMAAQLVFLLFFAIFVVEQFIIPTVQNTMAFMQPSWRNIPYLITRLLKLSIPSLVVWLCAFYAFFHLGLNIAAELLHFGDREFYQDWWNATTIAEYWRKWNLPVHNWLVRHIYFPLRRRNVPREVGSIAIFFLSALFHEFLASVPLGFMRFYFFLGMLGQSPLAIITELYTKGSQFGNIIFWITFCIIADLRRAANDFVTLLL